MSSRPRSSASSSSLRAARSWSRRLPSRPLSSRSKPAASGCSEPIPVPFVHDDRLSGSLPAGGGSSRAARETTRLRPAARSCAACGPDQARALCYQIATEEPGTLIMKTMTCIEDLRQAAHRKVPRAFFDYAEAGSYAEQTLRANRADLERIKLRQRILFDVTQAQHQDHDPRRAGGAAAGAGADRAVRHAARRRRDPGLPRRAGRGNSVHAVDDVDLLDRGRRGAPSTSRSGFSSTS